MRSLLQPGSNDQPKPLWLRWVALACVLLVCVMSTVQVYHVHSDDATPRQNSHQKSPMPEDRCPLCVAMHSALPVALHVAPEPMLQVQRLDSLAADVERVFRWRFEMASRPPPADLNRA
jgi:hypothetical protein